MPRCDEHGRYESRCPDCAQAFGHADCEETIAELRADVERLTRELREARRALRFFAPACSYDGCDACAVWSLNGFEKSAECDVHRLAGPDVPVTYCEHGHAPAIRAAEGET